jgi:hypothetical protein
MPKQEGSILESVIIVAKRLSATKANEQACDAITKKYRPLINCGPRKRDKVEQAIKEHLTTLYQEHKDDIMDRDFSFINDGTSMMFGDTDISTLVQEVFSHGSDKAIKDMVNELLFLFCFVMDDSDCDTVYERFGKRKDVAPAPSGSMDPTKFVQKMMTKNKDLIKRAESDPKARNEVITQFLQNSTGDLVDMLSGILQKSGIDE